MMSVRYSGTTLPGAGSMVLMGRWTSYAEMSMADVLLLPKEAVPEEFSDKFASRAGALVVPADLARSA
jgi:hypothetical protein